MTICGTKWCAEKEREHRERIAQLLAALKAVEWRGIPSEDERCCPECDQEKSHGHATDCIVGKAVRG